MFEKVKVLNRIYPLEDKYLDVVCAKDFKVCGFTTKDLTKIRKCLDTRNISLDKLLT